ncbi:MAG: hypothetical protein L0Y57_00620 [Beijerinckiaceae bacterium]|nr:hypothetical protein [Beijerinckiaceae bacterium]
MVPLAQVALRVAQPARVAMASGAIAVMAGRGTGVILPNPAGVRNRAKEGRLASARIY